MDKKDTDKQAEETKAGAAAQTGKPSESSVASTSADKAQADKGETNESQADKSQGDKSQASKGGSNKPAAKAGQKTGGKPAAPTGGDKTSSASGAAGAKAADGKLSGNPDAQSTGPSPANSSAQSSSAQASSGKGASAKGGDKDPGAKTPPPVSRARPPRRSSTPWLVIGMLILFALAAVGGWQLWQLQQAQQQASQEQVSSREALVQELDQEIERLDEQLGSTRSSISALEDRGEAIRQEVESGLQAQQDELAERQDHLDARIASIDDRLARGEIAWKTAEIGFLLTRAQERLTIARDPDGAMLALRLADQRVAALSRPHWLPLRSAISDAIAKIEAAGEGDRVGQALALRRLTDRVEDWPLADEADGGAGGQVETPADTAATGESLPDDAAWYEKAWAATSSWVAGQVTVSRSDTPTRLRERVATDREMRLWLTAVRESLLSRDHDALSTTLDEARGWLESHYATEADGPAKALKLLERTQERFASREFPSIDAVLGAWERANAREKVRAESADAPAETGKEDPS
ncbi:uroporphyrinogen-III C-methyltransferase [Guyparkeria sp. GHLCS8-2]|uniref:uroporphyrinogen-III C-methyltransferase n=1 Tax=Guyparkeria halopsychrophila TaxID=3139421 RepID=UPI0037CC78F4